MTNPSRENLNTIKRILKYIKVNLDVALCYGGSKFTIRNYVDSYFTMIFREKNPL